MSTGHMPLEWALDKGGHEDEPSSQLQQLEHAGDNILSLDLTNDSTYHLY